MWFWNSWNLIYRNLLGKIKNSFKIEYYLKIEVLGIMMIIRYFVNKWDKFWKYFIFSDV